MENKTITKITSGASAILLVVVLVMGANLLAQENVYVCLDREIAVVCDELSGTNALGIQTRCYFDGTYKICKDGWIEFENKPAKNITVKEAKEFVCDDGEFIKECRAEDGTVILRVKTE